MKFLKGNNIFFFFLITDFLSNCLMLNRMEFQDSVEVPNSYSGWPLSSIKI